MTLAMSWVRKIKSCEELIIASDSRLTGGGIVWDQCAKIMTLPRSDAAICFAGDTIYAYPLLSQLFFAIDSYSRSRDRAMDIHDMKGHVLNIFDELQRSVRAGSEEAKISRSNVEFIFGGYSWIRKRFAIWRIHYNKFERKFAVAPAGRFVGKFNNITFALIWSKSNEKRYQGFE